jgi:stress response protein SCP2
MGLIIKRRQASIGSIQKFVVGMGWDTTKNGSGQSFDLDAFAFMLNASNKV